MPNKVLSLGGQIGTATRIKKYEVLPKLKREMAAARIEQYVERVLAEAPPLGLEQRSHLAALFGGVIVGHFCAVCDGQFPDELPEGLEDWPEICGNCREVEAEAEME